MASGLAALLDDIAALAKVAAASIDDIGAAAGRASTKAAGVVIDDAAVTPAYVRGLAAERELPIIKRIAMGSIKNKLVFIIPIALLLSAIAPTLIDIILMAGGGYLCFEGAEKLYHKIKHPDSINEAPAVMQGPEAEDETVRGAVRTDLILSAEIMVLALKGIIGEGDDSIVRQAIILVVVAIIITAVVYGAVALIVKMDDIGLRLAETGSPSAQRFGRMLVNGMPKLLVFLTVIGTAAMLWVGGHIIIVGTHDLGWDGLYGPVHDLEGWVRDNTGGAGSVLAWLTNTTISAIVGLIVGGIIVAIYTAIRGGHGEEHGHDETVEAAH